jgi:hypothetical protein
MKAGTGIETVVIMPGGAALESLHRLEHPSQFLEMEAPVIMEDKVKSVSERLSILLKPGDPPTKDASPPAANIMPPCSSSKLLSVNKAAVLSRADVFVDAILQHVLADTTVVLDCVCGIPGEAPPTTTMADTVSLGEQDNKGNDKNCFLHRQAHTAAEQLHDLERELSRKYSRSVAQSGAHATVNHLGSAAFSSSPSRSGKLVAISVHGSHGIQPKCTEELCQPSWSWKSKKSRVAKDADELLPAALSLQRVREIEKYRVRFAHHCLASREAGIDRSNPGDAASVATWTIWPHLADAIALAVVESAIEEVHEAMEHHVEELVMQEVAGLSSED